jgi:hypothetical protein
MGALLGNLEGGSSFARGHEGNERKALGMGISPMAQLGNLEWVHLPGTLRVERDSRGGASLSMGALRMEPRGRAPLLGTLRDR